MIDSRAELIYEGPIPEDRLLFINEQAGKRGVPSSRITLYYPADRDSIVEAWLEHPEIELPGEYDEAARELKAEARAKPVTLIRHVTNFLSAIIGRNPYPTRTTGNNELNMMLTFFSGHEKPWHLSVLPIRHGHLFPWEILALKRSFFMQSPVGGDILGRFHFFW